MASQSSPFVSDTTQVRVELRNIIDEKALLDDIEGGLERARSKEDDERTKKRKKEDSEIVRKRAVADAQREARQEELCRCENVRFRTVEGWTALTTDIRRPYVRSSRRANYSPTLCIRHLLLHLVYVPAIILRTPIPSSLPARPGNPVRTNVSEQAELSRQQNSLSRQ